MRTLTKKYAAKFPESPKNVQEIIEYFKHPSIVSTTAQTLRKSGEPSTPFYKHAYECTDFSICLFASDDVLNIIETISVDRRMYFADGTFRIVPYGEFSQILLLAVDICGQVRIGIRDDFLYNVKEIRQEYSQ